MLIINFLQLLQVNEFVSNPSFLCCFSPLLVLILLLIKWLFTTPIPTTTTKNLPPSPPKLPIIGNFHQLGTLPHRSLSSLAQRYGPIMLLHFGNVPTLIVSSPDAAREIMKSHDLTFANKPELTNLKKLLYGMKDVAVSPYGEQWRQLKSIFVHNLLTKRRVQSFRLLREEETSLLVRKISESCSKSSSPVDMRDLFVTLSNDIGCRAAFGRKYTGGENGNKLKDILGELLVLLGTFCFRDFFPWLGWLDRLVGTDARVKKVAKGLDEFLEGLIEERVVAMLENHRAQEANIDEDTEDFVDILLKIKDDHKNGISLDRDSIKALLLDAYVGGSDTTATLLEWAMTELLRNGKAMKKLQNEVREVLNRKHEISEDDLEKMEYLKAVIKETFRIHPPIPLHSRSPRQDVEVMGYDVAAGTMVLVNVWHIANDPKLWDEPHEFRPERFLMMNSSSSSSIDFKGHDFEFIPFGAGRRVCPGVSFATAIIEHVLANLMHKFEWELPRGVKGEEMDMSECPGAVIHRKVRLHAVATPFF